MSFQAMAWASGTKDTPMIWGGPSARAAIMAIANHANDDWFCWAKQSTLAEESEQSADSIQRRIQEFIALGRIRRIKLKRFGRRTHDFLILRPSSYFDAPIEQIEPLLPRGCDIMPEDVMAAGCGSVESREDAAAQEDSEISAAATCGNAPEPTLPQPADHATALVRQPMNEPIKNPESPTQTLPQEGQADEEQKLDEAHQRLEQLKPKYPIPIFRPVETEEQLGLLSEADFQLLLLAAPIYGRECARLKRRPVDAHKFARDRLFVEFAKTKSADGSVTTFAPESPEGRAITTLYAIARTRPFECSAGIVFRHEITPQLRALSDAPDRRGWHWIEDRQQIGAWAELVASLVTANRPVFIQDRGIGATLRRGIYAPWPWPPRKDGSLCTGPPETLMTEEDEAELSKL